MRQGLFSYFAALLLWVSLGLSALAQEPSQTVDYEAWTALATRAEQVTEDARASSEAFETLRADVVIWRDIFLAAQDAGSDRITNLEAQIAALGPVPETGEEPAEIAQRRAELTEQLVRLRAPVLRAEEAYTRAQGIIRSIDTIIRTRQTDAFLELGPSPLNPTTWVKALTDLQESLRRSWAEITTNAASDALRAEAKANAPLILLYLALAVTLLARGRGWARSAVAQMRRKTRKGAGVWRFVLSLGQIALPLAGIYLLKEAAQASGMIGPRWGLLLDELPYWAGILLGIRWLADQAFSANDEIAALPLEPEDRAEARRWSYALAVLFVTSEVLEGLVRFDSYGDATKAVLEFPLLVLAGLMLFRLGRVRNTAAMALTEAALAPDAGNFRLRFARLVGRACMVVGVVGPVMAAIGYVKAGSGLVYPAIETLALIGLVLVLQEFVEEVYALLTGREDEDDESLVPVLAGFVITMIALPFLALIWGARVADLTELWARFREGFVLGETRISPSDFLVVVVVFAVGYLLTRLFQGALRTSVLPKTRIDQGGQNAIVSGVGYIGIFLAALIAISVGGLDLSSLAIVAGALSVGIGFGLQNIVSNFVSGIILLIERPISEGDWIEVNGTHGTVKDISVRSTRIETFDRYQVIIPNSDLVSGTVSNYTRGNVIGRITVPVGVAYGTDTRKVEKILLSIAREHDMVLMNPEPGVDFIGFGADSLDFQIRAVLRDVTKGMAVRTEMRHQIVERFADEGIEIPYAQRDVWIRNPEVLRMTSGTLVPDDDPDSDDDDAEQTTDATSTAGGEPS